MNEFFIPAKGLNLFKQFNKTNKNANTETPVKAIRKL